MVFFGAGYRAKLGRTLGDAGPKVSGVQVPLSPPTSLAVAAISAEQREMAAFVARLRRPNRIREGRISESFDAVRVFLSARAQVGSVSQLLRLNAAGPWLPISGHRE